jgi:hypothetical protein
MPAKVKPGSIVFSTDRPTHKGVETGEIEVILYRVQSNGSRKRVAGPFSSRFQAERARDKILNEGHVGRDPEVAS